SSLRDGPPTTRVRHARAAATPPHRMSTTPRDLPAEFAGATKIIQHPAAGTLQFGIEFLTSPSAQDQSLIVYTVEENSSTAHVLPILASWDPNSAITT
ncbi:MmyB family transcriptional regulator, partial [Rhodococcus sp. 06-1460-1B]|uniref:MmyB family transcriptional regulator n=1 Tax=Rhodococcus sp. 06-1460-1B TaxID=2022501 RepID=UPI003F91EB39